MSAKIVFTIKKGGEVTEKVEGIVGSSCEDLTRPIEQALGGQVVVHDQSVEYYAAEHSDLTLGEQDAPHA